MVDEAYHAFSKSSFIDRVQAYENVVLMRTLSKLGLAGLRLGFLMGDSSLLHELNKIRLPYNVNALTQASAAFALRHLDWFDDKAERSKTQGRICFWRFRVLPNWKSIQVKRTLFYFVFLKVWVRPCLQN